MLEKNKIVDLLCKELSYAYCDNCRHDLSDDSDESCDYCHRKYSGWALAESTAEYIADAIIDMNKGER